ncbi:MAG TPA: hypothetical protein VH597_15850 [Verrucomicrobiae bacterium]|jgi:hypothetical protein|nr:hypothetical protein [Verrucomicrobiae bacterium]
MKNAEGTNNTVTHHVVRIIRHSSFVIFLSILFLLPARTLAQSSNRWLIIFNTSAAMRNRLDGVGGVTQDLLSTAMHGNLRTGDTIGIWTYDSVLRADEAPLLTWKPEAAVPFTQHALEFLARHHYEKTAAFGDVLTNMLRVVKSSDVITVILVSDGSDAIQGTPFDARLTAFYKENYRAQKKAKMPVVTVFRGLSGKLTTNTVNIAPRPIDIPLVPPPPPIAKVVPKPIEAPKPPPPVVPSLIIIGKKAEAESSSPPAKPAEPAASESTNAAKIVPEEKAAPPVTPVVETPKLSSTPAAQTTNTPAAAGMNANPPPATPEAETAATVPSGSLFSARNLAIISLAFAVIVCGLLILTARRTRSRSQSSLITRSLDREE